MDTIKLPVVLVIFFILLFLWAFITPNPVITIISIALIPILIKMLWKKGLPPVLIAGMFFQWLSITIKVFYAGLFGYEFSDPFMHKFSENIEKTFYLSIVGLLFFSLGIYLAGKKSEVYKKEDFIDLLKGYNSKKILTAYLVLSLILFFYKNYVWLFPGVTQLLIQFEFFKWGLLFLAFSVCYIKKERLIIFFIIVFVEVIVGFTAYFSYFKEFIIFLFLFYLYYHPLDNLNFKKFSIATVVVALTIALGALWSIVKMDYREFLSGGIKEQVVTVSTAEALDELINVSKDLSVEYADIGVLMLMERLSYIDFFSAAIEYVPGNVPHTNGELFAEAFLHIVTPRLLFPDKPAIDDSEQLNKYTGLSAPGASEGTSISLGYMADAYIDFGYFMFISTFLLGFILGKIFYLILRKSYNLVWAYAFIIPMFYYINVNGTPTIKVVGGVFTYLIMWFVVNKFFVRKLDTWLKI